MKLPESVKIGPYIYPIEVKEKVVGDQNQDLWGHWFQFPQHRIEVKANVSPERTLTILLHECLHAIDEAWDVGLKERQILRLGHGLTAFLLDNDFLREQTAEVGARQLPPRHDLKDGEENQGTEDGEGGDAAQIDGPDHPPQQRRFGRWFDW